MKDVILLVEDESAIADNVVWALTNEGFEVAWVTTGADALRTITERSVHLVILDIGLPDGSGIELCKKIQLSRSMPVIFLSSRAGEIDRVVGLEVGADDYVTKPFSPRELCARVKNVLRRFNNAREKAIIVEAPTLKFGPVAIDPVRMRAKYFGTELELSKTEFRLLAAFVARPGQVLNRDQLMSLAWDEPDSAMERTVDAHIKSLRSKLNEVDPSKSAIETHRGSGYSFRETW